MMSLDSNNNSNNNLENEMEVQIETEAISMPAGLKLTSTVVIPIMNSPIFPGMIAPIVLTEDRFVPEMEKHLAHTG
ncbi:MAG: hypothetical protein HQK51_18230, partial [Oligoflexia bacterium]|nr:hypothetical protein [Oligoflexia bacterium]